MAPRRETAPPAPLLDRHLRFWRRQSCDRPLLRIDSATTRIDLPPVARVYGDRAGQALRPEEADVERFLACVDWSAVTPPGDADLFDVLPPYLRIPWLEAIAGCRVIPHPVSDSIWSHEPAVALHEPRRIEPVQGWLDALVRQVERLDADHSLPCPTCQTVLRGPGDLAEAMLGAEALCLAMADGSTWLEPFLGACTDLFIAAARAQLERIGPLWGGYLNFFGLWSPQPCVRLQEDVQILLSPAQYRRWLRPCLQRIVAQFPFSMYHIHSGSLRLVDEVLSVEGLSALEVAVDEPPYAPPIVEQIPILRRILERMPLLVEGRITPPVLRQLAAELRPEGLALRSASWVRESRRGAEDRPRTG